MKIKCQSCNTEFDVAEADATWRKVCGRCYAKQKESEKISIRASVGSNADAAFGMVFNNTISFLSQEDPSQGIRTFDKKFDELFDFLWNKMIQKRKEKLG